MSSTKTIMVRDVARYVVRASSCMAEDHKYPPNRIEYWLARRGMKRKHLAEAIGTSEQQIGKLINRERELTPTWMNKMAVPLKVLPRQFLQTEGTEVSYARLVGSIGKGEAYYSSPAGPWEAYDEIEAPAGLDDADALSVHGDWLRPIYRDGDVLYFRRDPKPTEGEFIDRECVVCCGETRAYLKIVRAGSRPGLYDLHSVLEDIPGITAPEPLRSVQIQWAAPIQYTRKGKR